MDEGTLQQLLAVQQAILAELRLLRQALAPGAVSAGQPEAATPPAPAVQPAMPQPAAPQPPLAAAPSPRATDQPAPAAPPHAPMAARPASEAASPAPSGPGAMLTLDELTDLGGQFLEPGQMNRTRVKSVDASDLSNSILDDIKAKNKAKRNAFAEFERFGKDR
ncbi:MAG: hypothetical protein ACP59X_20860 [Solidesulfovibrio sp. DCME]|uniref:hypothetical protein n=1 Tax=Solidesulfovibrio sp. DCME TaxID=3447380 RepID=UPI003D0D49E1